MTLPHADIDIEMLSTLVIEMNILRRHVTAYPAGHPVTRDAAVKVARLLDRLLDRAESVTLGIARDTILFGDYPLDRRNPVYRDFARVLSDRGVVALTCRRHLDADELLRFGALLSRSRDEIGAAGGIEEAARAEGFTRLEVQGVNYDLFRVTEEEELTGQPEEGSGSTSLWEQFVRGLLDGTIDPLGDATAKRPPLDPLLLAQVLNGHAFGDQGSPDTTYDAVIAAFMRRMERDSDAEQTARECAERFGTLVESLNPDLRHQFLGKAFGSLAERPDAARRLVASVDDGIILDTIAELNERNVTIPPLILNLCRKLGSSSSAGDDATPLSRTETLRVGHRLGTVLREGNFDQYIPDAYQGGLEQIVAAGKIASGLAESGDLKELLQGENHEAKVGAIILEVLESDPEGETFGMEESLCELCAYYLDAGDFTALRAVCDHLPTPGEAPSTPLQQRLLTTIGAPSFTTPLMDAPAVWGKERYDDIRTVITRIGFPCVAPLLDRLAEEESMSLRRYYVACLLSLGQAAYGEVVARLYDGRWFYVRNLVAILRGLNDPAAIHPLHRLLNHPHPRVRQETLRTLVHFRDPEGERMLLRELGSGNRDTLLTAIQLADRSRSPRVRERLLGLLHKGGITGPDFDVRCAVVRALAETGDPAVLPALARILRTRSILRTASVTRLKVEIARSLARYPAADALPLAREAAASGVPELEQAARQALRTMTGRHP
ncbi:HEAT repeat domain-containing protein [Geobacter hydrogenophilus]|nr:HEAT repeat domain-containing protein [Geobacter hydrogenophilus]MBT0895565.1 HEAT repeat domain-containing protein [Geobacter hydrogenophilus]